MAGTLHVRAVDRFPLQLGTHLPGRAHGAMLFGKDNRVPGRALARDAMGADICNSRPETALRTDGTRQLLDPSRSVASLLTPVLQRIHDDDDAHG